MLEDPSFPIVLSLYKREYAEQTGRWFSCAARRIRFLLSSAVEAAHAAPRWIGSRTWPLRIGRTPAVGLRKP
jgi:hypothetical protein